MFKFKDTKLQYNRRLRDSLTAIYGVGFQKSSYICDSFGLGLNFNINYLNSYFYEAIIILLKNYYIVDDRLKSIINQRINFFFENRRIVGLRLFKGLPVRGQRTQTNKQNARNLKPIMTKKIEISTAKNIKKKKNKKK
jgi:small subunit ribosomal protein S13